VLGPAEIGLLASLGYERVPVVRRPRVAVLSTGDELASPGTALAPGKIYDANTFSIAAAIKACGSTPVVFGPVPDDPQQLRASLQAALECDAVVTTAGVSMGDSDWVRTVVEEMGSLEFWQIRMRPGRPLAFGHLQSSKGLLPFFGLPGNPVSALVTFQLFVRPALFKMMGYPALPLSPVKARLEETVRNEDGRQFYARVTLRRGEDGGLLARLTGHQGSHVLTSLTRADGLAVIPEGCTELPAGSEVQVLLVRPVASFAVAVEEARYR
jgi:molybdopterin molybdotransferase